MRRMILTLALLVCSSPLAGQPAVDRLDRSVVPTFQQITLEIDPSEDRYSGTTSIEIRANESIESFRIHAEDLEIGDLRLEREGAGSIAVAWTAVGEQIVVSPEEHLEPANYMLTIEFANEISSRQFGLYRIEHEGESYLFTQFQPAGFRQAFPGFDQPEFKIPFQLTVEVPEGYEVISNTPGERAGPPDGNARYVFDRTKPLPSYLLFLAIGRFDSVEIDGIPIPGRIVTAKGESKLTGSALEAVPPIFSALERWFDMEYPYRKLDILAVPTGWGAMEHPGAITIGESYLLLDPETAGIRQRATLASLVAHEIAHMWFGNLVTMDWWNDLWLNESFATWLGDRIAHELFPTYQIEKKAVYATDYAMQIDARSSTSPVRRDVEDPDHVLRFSDTGIIYDKGRAVLEMFENWIGEETFRDGVRAYVREHAWSTASAEDLWRALSEEAGRDVREPMNSFVLQSGHPLVSFDVLPEGRLRISQKRFLSAGSESEAQQWIVPLSIRYSDGESVKTKDVLLDDDSMIVRLTDGAEIEWLMPNADLRGFYRWKLDAERRRDLASQAPAILNDRELAGLTYNLTALLRGGAISRSDYLDSLHRLSRDLEPEDASALLDTIFFFERLMLIEKARPEYQYWIRQTLGPLLDEIGIEPRAEESDVIESLRADLFFTLGRIGRDEAVLEISETLARDYMDGNWEASIPMAFAVLQNVALTGDEKLFSRFTDLAASAETPMERRGYHLAIGGFEKESLQTRAVEWALADENVAVAFPMVVFRLRSSEEGQELVWNWLEERIEEVRAAIPAQWETSLIEYAGECSEQRLRAARKLFSSLDSPIEGWEEQFAKTAEQVEDCVRLNRRERSSVTRYLREFSELR